MIPAASRTARNPSAAFADETPVMNPDSLADY
jgi:hypothetical protein